MGVAQWAAAGVVLAAVVAVARGAEVRLVLILAAATLGVLAGDPSPVLKTFLKTLADEKFVVPICTAMGFAYVIRHTGCDRHLVRLLMRPLRNVRGLLVPGVAAVAFVVNVPIISQTSTAVCVGPVAIPLLRAAGYSATTIGACLALGASVGGELLNPGAPELLTVSKLTHTPTTELARAHVPPLLFPYAVTAVLAFWAQTAWAERKKAPESPPPAGGGLSPIEPIHPLKAVVPLVPLILLFLTGPPLNTLQVPVEWLAESKEQASSRLIGAAMLVGVVVAAAVTPIKAKDAAKQFFEGAGYGYAAVISLIVTANCFGEAIKQSGLADVLGHLIAAAPNLLLPLAAAVPAGFAAVSGSGMASTQSLYGFFHGPALALGRNPDAVGAVVSIGAAAGRTASPVAAVVVMCGTLAGVPPTAVVKRVAGPLVVGLIVTVALRMFGVV